MIPVSLRAGLRGALSASLLAVGLLAGASGAAAQPAELDAVIAEWRGGRYEIVVQQLKEIRREPYGRNVYVDYMLATSLCRLAGMEDIGQRYFERILASYDLGEQQAGQVRRERESCRAEPIQIAFDSMRAMAAGGVRGKTFYWLNQENAPLAVEPVRIVREIPRGELDARLFPQGRQGEALERIGRVTGGGLQYAATDRFVLASSSDQSPADLETIGLHLEQVMRFYNEAFAMPMPPSLVSVYLAREPWSFRQMAERVHGLGLGDGGIGYSFSADLSLAAVVSGTHTGTLKHELFHLMVRSDFGDIPPWLDEGMASLYEVSRMEGERVRGLRNWREPVLRRFWSRRPAIAELVRMDWQAFDAGGHALEQQAVNHATARYFMLYLQETGNLEAVYAAFRDQRVEDLQGTAGDEAARLLQTTLGERLTAVDASFAIWFQSLGEIPTQVDIGDLQSRLNALGYDAGKVDGLLGPTTRAALRAFQQANSLPITGQPDLGTRAAIRSLTGKE